MKVRPLNDRVMVKRLGSDEKTPGGLYIPDTAKEKSSFAEVVAIGPGMRNDAGVRMPVDVAVGDRVLLGKWEGIPVTIDGVEHLSIRDVDIIAVIELDAPVMSAR